MKKLYTGIIGLLCCMSCDTHDSQVLHTQDDAWPYIATEEDLQGAQQPVIKECRWGHVIIKMRDGTEKSGKDYVLTPQDQDCCEWTYGEFGHEEFGHEEFGRKKAKKISHLNRHKPKCDQGTGVLPYAIKKLLQNAPTKDSNIVVIVSTGVHGQLGISQAAEDYLIKLRDDDKTIEKYYIRNSRKVPYWHNKCVKDGYQVYTLLHTTC